MYTQIMLKSQQFVLASEVSTQIGIVYMREESSRERTQLTYRQPHESLAKVRCVYNYVFPGIIYYMYMDRKQ